MKECICNSCKNLNKVNEASRVETEYECEFGFPSKICLECNDKECELTCDNYIPDDEQDNPIVLYCKSCGKELLQLSDMDEEGDAYCFECYLENV